MKKKLGTLGLLLASLVSLAGLPAYGQSWGHSNGYNRGGYSEGWNGRDRSYDNRNFDRGRNDWNRRDFERSQRAWRERQRWEQRRWNSYQFRNGYGSRYGNPYRGYYNY